MTPSNSPQDLQLPPVPGLDDPFVSGAAQQRDHGPSVFGPDFSFDVMDPTSPVNSQGPWEEPSYPYLGANIKHLSEAKTSMEEELTHIKGENNSLALCLESINETLGELQESIGQQKQTPSRTNSNHHAVLKSIIQLLFSQFCGVDCDGTRKKCTVALAVVKPLGDKQLYKLTDKGMQIWHPDWLDKVDDEINMKFIKELAKCAFNNEKVLYTYVTFLHWLSLHAMKQQQDANDEPDLRQVGQEPQHKQCRTTKKLHKCVFNIGPKHLSHYLPQAKAMVFKAMVDDRWYDEHLDMVVHEGINWLKGFYSHINTEDLFEADMTYLKELDDWLKTETLGQYRSSEDEE
ncbi:hypothetical protein J3A83DRAFT_4369885 [Scleroderma citrinum]